MNPAYSTNSRIDLGLLLLRLSAGGFMLTHGLPKLMNLTGSEPVQFATVFGMSAGVSLTLAVFAEAICALLIMVGLFTRLASIPLVITMSVAAFSIHAADPFGKKELALLYLVIFLFFMLAGAGRYSIDHILTQRRSGSVKDDRKTYRTAY